MRHRKRCKFPASSTEHAKSILRNQAAAVLMHGQIVTTTAKAKCLRPYLERLITKGIRANAAASDAARIAIMRHIDSKLRSAEALDVLMNVASRIFANRPGGYTRILKAGFRDGDCAELSLIQLVTEASQLDFQSAAHELEAAESAQERYAILKEYCLKNRYPSRSVLAQWAAYRFPKFALSIHRGEPSTIRTSLQIPASRAWDRKNWPTVRSQAAPLELALRFFGDSRHLQERKVSMRLLGDTDAVALFSNRSDGTALTFAINPETFDAPRELVIEHRFVEAPPQAFSAALMSPYSTLRSVRSIEPSLTATCISIN